jgi:ABC-2 type transport system permease protein
MFIRIINLVRLELFKLSRQKGPYFILLAIIAITLIGAYLLRTTEEKLDLSTGGYGFAIAISYRGLDVSTFFLLILASMLFSSEVGNGTIKTILTRPLRRFDLLLAKYITALILVIIAILLIGGIGLLSGLVYYGLEDLKEGSYVIYNQQQLLGNLGLAFLFCIVPLFCITSLGVTVSTFSNNTGASLGISIGIFILLELLCLTRLRPFLFPLERFTPLLLVEDMADGLPIAWRPDIYHCLLICSIYTLLFFIISSISIKKRDFLV